MPSKRSRKKTAEQFSVEQWMNYTVKKKQKEAERKRKAKRREEEGTAEKEERLQKARDREAKRREEQDTAKKEERRQTGRDREAKRREEEGTAKKEERRQTGRDREAKRREEEGTAKKEERRQTGRDREAKRREEEGTAKKGERRQTGRDRESKRREEEGTAKKKERRQTGRDREAKRREEEGTAKKEERRQMGRDREAKRREEEGTAKKEGRRQRGRDRDAKRREEEGTAKKEEMRQKGRDREAKLREKKKSLKSDSSLEKSKKKKSQKKFQKREASQARRSLNFDHVNAKVTSAANGDDALGAPDLPFSGLTDDLLAEELMVNPIHAFHVAMWSLENTKCENCKERSFLIDVDQKKRWCQRCRNKRLGSEKFTTANDMDPGEQPDELKGLTQQEEILISPAVPMMSVYRLPLGQLSYTGNIVNRPQDVQHVADLLPRTVEESGMIIFRSHGRQGSHKDFRVRREKVERALLWLKQNNKRFEHIKISEERLASLPQDGFIDATGVEDDDPNGAPCQSGISNDDDDPHQILDADSDSLDLHNSSDVIRCDNDRPSHEAQEANPNPIESFVPCAFEVETELSQKRDAAGVLLENAKSSIRKKKIAEWPIRQFDQPIDEFNTAGYIFDCFPTLFPRGTEADLLGNRPIKFVSTHDYFKHLINFHDGRFARHPRFRYFALNTILRHRAMDTGRVFVKKNKDVAQLTVEELQNMSKNDHQRLMNMILRYGQSFAGSKPYWMSRRGELLAMLKQKAELPTVFFTMSAADCQWPDLHRHMPGNDEPGYSKYMGVSENPLLCNLFFFLRVKKYLKFMEKRFNMVDFWGRFEYQHRGSIHFHGLGWFGDAPDIKDLISKSADERQIAVQYFDKLLTAVNPGLNDDGSGRVRSIKPNPASVPYFKANQVFNDEDTDYTGIIMYCHRHLCRVGYCCKEIKGQVQPCRFRFPKDLVSETNIEEVEDAKGRKKCVINLKRNDRYINSHTKDGALANRANTDFQPCIDVQDVASYCAKYVTKPEKMQNIVSVMLGLLAMSSVPVLDPMRKMAQKALIRLISDRDYSAQETIHFLLSLPLYLSSRTFVPISLSCDHELTKEGGEAVLVSNPVDRYCARSKSLEHLSLFQLYQTHRYEASGFKKLSGQKQNIVVPKGLRKVGRESENYEEYCERYLMLHKPFRNFDDLRGLYSTFARSFEDFVASETFPKGCFEDLDDRVVEEENVCQQPDEHSDEDRARELALEEYAYLLQMDPEFKCFGAESFDWMEAYSKEPQAYDRVKEFYQSMDKIASTKANDDFINSVQLNSEQEKAFNAIKSHADCNNPGKEPLNTIVTGSAGTGKTIFIKKLKKLLGEKLFVMAPTGVAACNADGLTVNSALGIPAIVSEESFAEKGGASKELLQERFQGVEYVILEEVSMIGLRKLCMIDKRLREAFPSRSNKLFGGCSVILIGDFGQLPPIGDYSLIRFVSRHWSEIAGKISAFQAQGLLAYMEFRSCFKFSTVVRQSGDTIFRDLLQRVRVGEVTKDDYELLSTRFRGNARDEASFADAVHLFTSRKEVMEFNLNKLKKLGQPVAVVEAEHTGGAAAKKASSDDAGNLEPTVLLSRKAKVMLTANVNVSKGLCNGTMGEVVDIIYRHKGPPTLPLCVLCHFDDYSGPAFYPDRSKVVPVVPITRRFQISQTGDCSRTNIPLRLAWAITIHKSQGLTLPKAVLNLGKSEFNCGLTFVGLSRVRELRDLLLDRFEFSRLADLGAVKKDKSNPIAVLKREDQRLAAMSAGDIADATDGMTDLQSKIAKAKDAGEFKVKSKKPGRNFSKIATGNATVVGKKGGVKRKLSDTLQGSIVKDGPQDPSVCKDNRTVLPGDAPRLPSAVDGISFQTPTMDVTRKRKAVDKTVATDSSFPPSTKRRKRSEVVSSHDASVLVDRSSFLRPETSFVREDQLSGSFSFRPLSEERMREVCGQLGDLTYNCRDTYDDGGPRHVGAPPNRVIPVPGDDHCFYHVVSRALTGRSDYHLQLRNHLARFYEGGGGGSGIEESHIRGVRTNSWADGQDAMNMSRLLGVPMFMYARGHHDSGHVQFRWFPCGWINNAQFENCDGGIYLFHCDVDNKPAVQGNHFSLVTHV